MSHDNGFETFFKKYQNIVCRVILGYVREHETAEDITIEAFLRVFDRWDRVRTMESPGGYLMRTGINCARTFLRERGKRNIVAITGREKSGGQDSPELLFFQNEECRELERALLSLKEKERNIIIMKDIGGRIFREISDELGIKLPTVKSLYRRGKIKLLQKMGFQHET
jgi:RNA polymerase sigma-70 factor (ECF subfamily)